MNVVLRLLAVLVASVVGWIGYVQEIDRTGEVLREYKNTMGPDGQLGTEWVRGGP